MSQIIGIICKDNIVIASETQYTDIALLTKTTNAKKISAAHFKNGSMVLGETGAPSCSARAVQYINELAADKEISDASSVVTIIEQAINMVRQDLIKGLQVRAYSPAEQEEVYASPTNYFALMIGFYTKEVLFENGRAVASRFKPHLYTIRAHNAIACKEHPFAVIGAADSLAIFILKQFRCETLGWREAACLVVDALERIKADNIYCGGDIQFGTLDPHIGETPTAAVGDTWNELMARVVDKLKVLRERHTKEYKSGLEEVMKEIHIENMNKFYSENKALEGYLKSIDHDGPA